MTSILVIINLISVSAMRASLLLLAVLAVLASSQASSQASPQASSEASPSQSPLQPDRASPGAPLPLRCVVK